METFIRNFAIIAHIDHGKSTLADRFLEITNTVALSKMNAQFLDKMFLEQEKGITIKMHPCQMKYTYEHNEYTLNLIDTPGHVDFVYEVSRSLAAIEGAILLVDATQGIQAQTLGNLYLAQKHNLTIIPVLNKIDLKPQDVDILKKEIQDITKISAQNILSISAKTGQGTEDLLKQIIKTIPAPIQDDNKPLRALIFDSRYDSFKGVLAYVRVFDGTIHKNDDLYLIAQKLKAKTIDIGIFKPDLESKQELKSGEIGWIATGLKDPTLVKVGDTITHWHQVQDNAVEIMPLPGYEEPQPMVFAGFYPDTNDDFENLQKALAQLKLNDAALFYEPESNEALGRGFRLGFLGILHYEIISLRLEREFNLNIITTTPTVPYKVTFTDNKVAIIKNPADFPSSSQIKFVEEPYIQLEILTPSKYLNNIISLLATFRSEQVDLQTLSQDLLLINYKLPLSELLLDLYDKLKSSSQGFASMNYKIIGYEKTDVCKLDVLLHHEKFESLSFITPNVNLYAKARKYAETLKNYLPRQIFPLEIQVAKEGDIIARETLPAFKKDVTGYLYGGDRTRKMKLWKKQQKGKKKLAEKGKIELNPSIYRKIFLNKE